MLHFKSFGKMVAIGGLAMFLCPAPSLIPGLLPGLIIRVEGQRLSGRLRRPPVIPPGAVLVPTPAPRPDNPKPSALSNATPAPAPLAPQPATSAALPPSLLEKPAQPAQIEFSPDLLSIRADNSSLGEILNTLSAKSGMHIAGLNGDERVFGNFGPGTPRAVLSDLLNGTPYNILMVGDLSNGAPRQLILSPESSGSDSTSTPQPSQTAETDRGQNDSSQPAVPRPGFYRPGVNPGLSNPAASDQQPGAPNQVKTPQELFRELQEMRQQRLQGQQQQN